MYVETNIVKKYFISYYTKRKHSKCFILNVRIEEMIVNIL